MQNIILPLWFLQGKLWRIVKYIYYFINMIQPGPDPRYLLEKENTKEKITTRKTQVGKRLPKYGSQSETTIDSCL
jgi:hypothetical protein